MNGGFLKGAALGAVISGVMLASTVAFAGNGVGGVFNLGTTNSVNGQTALQGATNSQQLRVTNTNTGGNASGIGIVTPDNVPPLAVHSKARVINLNADTVDGLHASQLVGGGGHVVRARLALSNPGGNSTILEVPGFGKIEAICGPAGFNLFWRNATNPSAPTNDFFVLAGRTHFGSEIGFNFGTQIILNSTADQTVTQQVSRSGHIASLTTSGHWTPTGCIFDSQADAQ